MKFPRIGFCFALMLSFGLVDAATINVPADQPTIQAAINVATNGDTVLVAPGTYVENLDYDSKAIAVMSSNGPGSTLLAPSNPNYAIVYVEDVTQLGASLQGFTIANGGPTETIVLRNLLTFVLQNNVFHDNVPVGTQNTAVVHCENADALIRSNLFYDNGGISCVGINMGTATVVNNTMDGNARGLYTITGQGVAKNNIVTNSLQYGIWGMWSDLSYNDSYNNNPDFDGGAGAGLTNLSVDPLYTDAAANDYSLAPGSPCIDAGDPDSMYNDTNGTRNDMGYTGGAEWIIEIREPMTITVPGDFATIQAALVDAVDFDTILVSAGTYVENIDYLGKAVVLRSVDGPETTILEPQTTNFPTLNVDGAVFGIGSFEGFTVRNGGPVETIRLSNMSGFLFQNNIVHNNIPVGTANTTVLICRNADALITRNIFYDNGGISAVGINSGTATVQNNTFDGNARGFYTISYQGVARNNIVTNSTEYGIWGEWAVLAYNDSWNNGQNFAGGAFVGATNLQVNPAYTDAAAHDYSLSSVSPCINAGDPDPAYNDSDGSRNDMGAIGNNEGGVVITPEVRLVPSEYATIQSAIDSSYSLDTILVAPGTYNGALNYNGKSLVIMSTDGPMVTTITSDPGSTLVTIESGEPASAVLEGFTLAGGRIGIYCRNTGVQIRRNILRDQNVSNWAAISIEGTHAAPTIINNTIVNSANGGISTYASVPAVIKNNIIAFNAHYGIHRDGARPDPVLSYNNVFGSPVAYYEVIDVGTGTISEDPLFYPDYSLGPGSPCINAGDPAIEFNDPDGSRNDMGAVPAGGGVITPTSEWISLYCANPTLNGQPLMPGSVIRAYDPDGVLCGIDFIDPDGSYGFLQVYRDDSFTAEDEGADPGDEITLVYGFDTLTTDVPIIWGNNGDVIEMCTFSGDACVTFNLQSGWNLISWNTAYTADIEVALAPIIDQVDVVLSFDGVGQTFVPELAEFSNLPTVDYAHGYWIRMNAPAAFSVCGEMIAPTSSIPLAAGWNLVSYWPSTTNTVEDALASVLPGIEVAFAFDDGILTWMPGQGVFNTLTDMSPGLGYWLYADQPATLTWPGFTGGGVARLAVPEPAANDIAVTDQWMAIYGRHLTLDGQPLADGSTIEVYTTDGILCGRGVYHGDMLKMTAVYGDSPRHEDVQLAGTGESLQLTVNGEAVAESIAFAGHGAYVALSSLTSGSGDGLPRDFALEQNYPNPFNPTTTIAFALPHASDVRLVVYNILGRQVKTLVDDELPAGTYSIEWDGKADGGNAAASGVYLYRLEAGDFVASKRMLLIK